MSYQPTLPPTEQEHLQQYLLDEFQRIATAISEVGTAKEVELRSLNNLVNGGTKRRGLRVMVAETNRQVYSSGKNPTDDWVYEDGTVAYSPS